VDSIALISAVEACVAGGMNCYIVAREAISRSALLQPFIEFAALLLIERLSTASSLSRQVT